MPPPGKPFSSAPCRRARLLAPAVLLLAAVMLAAPARANGRIDVAHTERDRQRADACILGGVVIYTDPYIASRLHYGDIVANIARMCATPFARYADDRGFDAAMAQSLLRRVIEAGLRGQFREDGSSEAGRDAR